MRTTRIQFPNPFRRIGDESGATVAAYAIVTGAIALVSIGAVTYLNLSTESKIQDRTDKAGQLAVNKGSASLGGEVAKSTAINGGMDVPFQFGVPLFGLASGKKKKQAEEDPAEIASNDCPGGVCPKGQSTCFVAGTLVLTPTGYRKIEDIKVGDEVLSVAEDSPWATAEVEEEVLEDEDPIGTGLETGSTALDAAADSTNPTPAPSTSAPVGASGSVAPAKE